MNKPKVVVSIVFALLIWVIAACSPSQGSVPPAINTDAIAGYWSGKFTKQLEGGEESPSIDVGILLISGCEIGEVCGKFAENNECPRDIIFHKVEGEKYFFLAQTQTGTTHACGIGKSRIIELKLLPDGSISFAVQSGASSLGVLRPVEGEIEILSE
jgi:hypothetical protein